MIQNYYIFVEGTRDKLFIQKVFFEKLKIFDNSCLIVEYKKMEHKNIKNFINSINKMSDYDYIFISDQDGKIDKKNKVLNTYPFLDKNKVFISIFEIESWIMAGISNNILKKYKLKPIPNDTSHITKEMFENIIPNNYSKVEFIADVLENYNTNEAIDHNKSFDELYSFLCTKKAS